MYEIFQYLCDLKGVTPYRVSEETGIKTTTLSAWKKGDYTPKLEKLQLIAKYFNVSLDYLVTGNDPGRMPTKEYYMSDETKEIAQDLHDNGDLRLLFDVARDCTPEQLKILRQMAESWDKQSR